MGILNEMFGDGGSLNSGVICDVKDCKYHSGESCCNADKIQVGPCNAHCISETCCSTYCPKTDR